MIPKMRRTAMILPHYFKADYFTPYEGLLLENGGKNEIIPKDTVLHEFHAPGRVNSFYIKKGIIKNTLINEDGGENIIYFLGIGAIYPINVYKEIFSMENYMYLTAVTDVEIIRFPSSLLVELSHKDKGFAEAVINSECRSSNLFLTRMLLNTYNNSLKLVCSFLYIYLYNRPVKNNVINMTQEDVGKITGLSRMQITRVMNTLRTKGIIKTGRGNIKVLDIDALRDFCPEIVNDVDY